MEVKIQAPYFSETPIDTKVNFFFLSPIFDSIIKILKHTIKNNGTFYLVGSAFDLLCNWSTLYNR